MTGHGSRIKGMGSLLRSLRALVARVDRYGQHRASTADERRWCNVLADKLDYALAMASADPQARASLAAVDRRAAVSAKTKPDMSVSC